METPHAHGKHWSTQTAEAANKKHKQYIYYVCVNVFMGTTNENRGLVCSVTSCLRLSPIGYCALREPRCKIL